MVSMQFYAETWIFTVDLHEDSSILYCKLVKITELETCLKAIENKVTE